MKAEVLKIKKSISINAPKEKVWEVLLQDHYNRQWFAEFSEGTKAETDWQVGSKVLYTDASGSGMIGKIITNRPAETLDVEYEGFVADGQEDYTSEGAQALKGGRETYRLSEANGVTQLAIESDMSAEWFEQMSLAWDRALQKIKELSEKEV